MSTCVDHGQKGRGQGYAKGLLSKGFRGSSLHRQVFFEANGYLPAVVRHTCDNPRCINPVHLVGGTQKDNLRDRRERGRAPKSQPTKRKLTLEQARQIRARWALRNKRYADPNGAKAIARDFGVAPLAVYNIVRGVTYVA